jgi:hypothetical protein
MAIKTYAMCVLFGSASSFASTAALARSIEGVCGMPSTFPRSKHLNISYEQAFGAYAANQKMHIATQHNICVTNQDTAKRSTTSVKPIKSEKIKQWCRDRPRFDALGFRAIPASIVEYRLKNCLPLSASLMPPLGFQRETQRADLLRLPVFG